MAFFRKLKTALYCDTCHDFLSIDPPFQTCTLRRASFFSSSKSARLFAKHIGWTFARSSAKCPICSRKPT